MKWGKVFILAWILAILLGRLADHRTVGTISGPELEYLQIGEDTYQVDPQAPFHGTDKEDYLGDAVNGETSFQIYTLKGTDQYLYCRWEWEGDIYKKVGTLPQPQP